MKLKTVILEDSLVAKISLENFCKNYPFIEFIDSYETAAEAIEYLKENKVDLIFLDVELKDGLGWKILDLLDSDTTVVLTTSHEKYFDEAKKSINIKHFMLKPIYLDKFLMIMSQLEKGGKNWSAN